MIKFLMLLKGELFRLKKYNVLTVSFLVTLIWVGVLYFIEDHTLLNQMLPSLLMVDTTMMATIFIGATLFFEKSEQTVATLLVTPVNYHLHILAKTIANTLHTFLSAIAVALVFYFVREVTINFLMLVPFLLITAFFHSVLGYVFSYFSKEFTSMLMLVMAYSLLFMIPSILRQFGILFTGEGWRFGLIVSPGHASLNLVTASVTNDFSWESIVSLLYLISITFVFYFVVVIPNFKKHAVKSTGV